MKSNIEFYIYFDIIFKEVNSLFNFVFGENLFILGIGLVMLKVNKILWFEFFYFKENDI